MEPILELIPPEPTTTSKYEEAQIVDLLSQLYRTFEHYGYLHDDDGEESSDPTSTNWPPPEGRAIDLSLLHPDNAAYAVPPYMVQLFHGQDEDGAVLLDVTNNMILVMDSTGASGDTGNEALGLDERSYPPDLVNWPKEHAPTFLQKMNKKILDLDWYPDLETGTMVEPVDERLPYTLELRRILREEYHWPGNGFRRDAWMEEFSRCMEEAGFPR